MVRLKWKQVDLQAGVIRLAPSKTARHGIGVVIPVCASLKKALETDRGPDSDGWVLPEHPEYYPNPWQSTPGPFADVLTMAKVEGRHTFHSWRHTFRTRLAEAGVSDEIAKRLGGWTVDKRWRDDDSLWGFAKSDSTLKDWQGLKEFRFRRCGFVEHIVPQQQMECNAPADHSFRNLALISASRNSKFSNEVTAGKEQIIRQSGYTESLKMFHALWSGRSPEEHGNMMYDILANSVTAKE